MKVLEEEEKLMADAVNHYSQEEQMKGLLEQLDAYISHYHGGSVEFVSYENGIVRIKLGGACEECPLSPTTVHGWVEGTIRQFFPEIKGVEQV
jgi:Fe-S cluster biogenesis protein NfuA